MLHECRSDAQSECEDDESCRAMREYARPLSKIFPDHCVVAVRAGQDGTEEDAIRVEEDVVFGTGSRAIRRDRASFRLPNGSHRRRIDGGPREIELVGLA